MDIKQLNVVSKEFAGQLLDLVSALSDKMITRSEDSARSQRLSTDQSAGFTMKEEIDGELSLYADVFAKSDDNDALLRISGIVVSQDVKGGDMFNSLTLQFDIDETTALQTTSSVAKTEVDDIRRALNHEKTTLKSVRHSNSKDSAIDSDDNRFYDLIINTKNEVIATTTNEQPITVSIDYLTTSIQVVLDMFQTLANKKI
jgi:multidrug efflux pump subunit AcrA (membrane-fusion protein)